MFWLHLCCWKRHWNHLWTKRVATKLSKRLQRHKWNLCFEPYKSKNYYRHLPLNPEFVDNKWNFCFCKSATVGCFYSICGFAASFGSLGNPVIEPWTAHPVPETTNEANPIKFRFGIFGPNWGTPWVNRGIQLKIAIDQIASREKKASLRKAHICFTPLRNPKTKP